MRSKALSAVFAMIMTVLLLSVSSAAFAADDDIDVLLNGRRVNFDSAPVMVDEVMMVEARPLANAMGFDVKWSTNTQSVRLTGDGIGAVLKMDYDVMTVSDLTESDDVNQVKLAVAPMVIDGCAYVPLRSVAEAFGVDIYWDSADSTVKLSTNGYEYGAAAAPAINPMYYGGSHTFYFQNQSCWQLPNYGSGYCWTVSYAMLLSDVLGYSVTPVEVASVNEAAGGSGSYCNHWKIASAFGVDFVSALDTNSPYYGGRDSNSGGTFVNCSSDYEAIQAIKEALDRNPAGVMVRYADYPHTMVAVGYDGDTVFFNEPMQISHSYTDYSSKEYVTFDETCIGASGISIGDITFIQALAVK